MQAPSEVLELLTPAPKLGPWDWTCQHVDFALNPKYRAATAGKFDPALLPFWREPMEKMFENATREIFVVAPTQGGKSENLIVSPLRYMAATTNKAIMYVAAQQEKAEEFFIERIKRGMTVAAITAELAERASERSQVYDIGLIQVVLGWAAGKDTFKMRPFDVIFCDEVSSWKSIDLLDQARKRFATRPFSKLIGVSSPDPMQKRPSEDDPIWIEWEAGDQREWFVKDPVTGKEFVMDLKGIKWDQAAKTEPHVWDLDMVKATAHYITPDGTRIDEADRKRVIMAGRWVATNPKAVAGKLSYRFNQLLFPWESGSFGEIAKKFLDAKRKGADSLRTFTYEVLAEKWKDNLIQPTKDIISQRAGGYARGTYLGESEQRKAKYAGKSRFAFLSVDVQKAHLWWLAREWIHPGHSGLVDFGWCVTWKEIEDLAKKHKVERVGVDCGYEARRGEVETYCSDNNDILTRGGPPTMKTAMKIIKVPTYQGTYRQGQGGIDGKITLAEFNPDAIKMRLWQMALGASEYDWFTFDYPGTEYLWQMQSEQCVDGHWALKKSHGQNHLWDCEVIQVVLARLFGLLEDYTLGME